jgi:hypothetical protein
MKRNLLFGGLLIVAAANATARIQTNSAPPAKLSPAAESSKTNGALGVEQFMKNVERYPGNVRVEGVVVAVSATNQMLGLIDTREFQTCGLEGCALSLPVRWTGAMPAPGETVRVGGCVQTKLGKLSFVAQTLEKVSLPPKGKE